MKKFFFFLCCITYLVACNNQGSTGENGGKDSGAEKNSAVSTTPASSKGSCDDLMLFHKGAVIEGVTYDGAGKEIGGGTTTVQDVRNEGGIMIADVEVKGHTKSTGESVHTVQYKCDGKNLSYDLASMMASFSVGKFAKVEGDAIEFPISLSTGQTLPDASYSIHMNAGKQMTVKSTIKDRKVEGVEKITTTAGSWDCFKVTSTIDGTVSMNGDAMEQKMADVMKKAMGHQTMAMWFAPGVGIVKMAMYKDNVAMSSSEVTAIKQ